jgi:EpsI family protein
MERSLDAAARPQGSENVELPPLADCGPSSPWTLAWRPDFEGPDRVMSGTYACTQPVSVFVATYLENTEGKKLVNDRNRLLPNEWSVSPAVDESFENAAGERTAVAEVRLREQEGDALVWFWYRVGERTATSTTGVKLLQALQLIKAEKLEGQVYLVTTPLRPALESARQRLKDVAARIAADNTTVESADLRP